MLKREGVLYYLKERVLFYTWGRGVKFVRRTLHSPLAGKSWDREKLGSDVQGAHTLSHQPW